MAFTSSRLPYDFSLLSLILFVPLLFAFTLAFTYFYTTARFHASLKRFTAAGGGSSKLVQSPRIPYVFPFLGNALAFLNTRPGGFWEQLFRFYPRQSGVCTLLLGGRTVHILFSPTAVHAILRNRNLTRHVTDREIRIKSLDFSKEESSKYETHGMPDEAGLNRFQRNEKIFHDYLLRVDCVNELTAQYTRFLEQELGAETFDQPKEVGLFVWLRSLMFRASTISLYGKTILELCPNLEEEFFEYEKYFINLFFGIPKWIDPAPHKARAIATEKMQNWHRQMLEKCNGNVVDPQGDVDWEPNYGSRLSRAWQLEYRRMGLNIKNWASLDLGLMFGLSSNAIPATGWLLMHLLDPEGDQTLLGRVMRELQTAKREDGSLDIPTLVNLPLLSSTLHEVFRLYTDVFITRELEEDLVVPLDEQGKQVLLKKNSMLMAPTWLNQHDEATWTDPPSNVFYAERFLREDPKTGKQVFSTAGTQGKLFPFGGGKAMCPGRVFAKQEMLATAARLLLDFDFEFIDFVDWQGNVKNGFPKIRHSYGGVGVVGMDSDIKVRIKRRGS